MLRSRRAAVSADLTMYACVFCISARCFLSRTLVSSLFASGTAARCGRRALLYLAIGIDFGAGVGTGVGEVEEVEEEEVGTGERLDEVFVSGWRTDGVTR